MAFTLKKAGLLSPKTLRNEIVQDYSFTDHQTGDGVASAMTVFPTVELSSSKETYFRRNGARTPMVGSSLTSESPISDIEDLTEDDVTVSAYKEKISPEKGVDTDLNSEVEILRLFQEAAAVLREDIALTREVVCWRGDNTIDGMIGRYGTSAHPALSSSHVIVPDAPYTDTAASTPQSDFQMAQYLISEDGIGLDQAGSLTAYCSPSMLLNLKQNDDLETRFSGVEVQGLTQDQVSAVLPFDSIETVRVKVPRKNANGQLINEAGQAVRKPADAAMDNILEPYDPAQGRQVRNVVIGRPGEVSAFMPWFADRLAEHADNAPPGGQFDVDRSTGIMTQTWTDHDPVVSWLKVAQEIGFHIPRPDNWVVLQDV